MNKEKNSDTPVIVLVDGSSYLYRAFHALPPLTNSKGHPTGAIYGVLNMLRRLMKDYSPHYVAVVFDAKGKTFRDEIFEQYKSHRPPMPDDLSSQIEPLHAVVQAMGLPLLSVAGVEADDVIGTLAKAAAEQGINVVISTGDKDMAQLVNDHITLVNTMSDTVLDPNGVKVKFGVRPDQIVDYLALIGDTSDNIPGVPKVGPKTAAKWLAEYDSLDALVAHAKDIGGKVGENLRAHLDQLPMGKALATIKCDVELTAAPTDLVPQAPDSAALREWYEKLEFKTWLKQLNEGAAEDPPANPATPPPSTGEKIKYEMVTDPQRLAQWISMLAKAPCFAFDTETTSLDYMKAEIVGVSFCAAPQQAAYVPVAHDYPGAPTQLSRDFVLNALKSILESPDHPKVGQHIKYDMNVLGNHGVSLAGIRHDTMLESYVLDSTATRHDMDSLAEKYLDYKTIHFEDVAGSGAKQLTFNQVDVESATQYAAEDADVTFRLHETLWPKLQQQAGLKKLYQDIEIPLIPVLSRMERHGVLVDAAMLRSQSGELAERMGELETKAHELAGHPFNLGSPKQIQEILFDRLGLPVLEKTPKGQPSTAESVLQELALDFPLPKVLLEYRSLSKLKSTYTDKLPEQINPRTGRVHTSYHQAVAATGRLSSSDPNLQNIPIRSNEGRRIRQAFVAPEGCVLIAADYSQIELRIMAHLSEDERLKAAFAAGDDIHRATAAEIFGVAAADVTSDMRRSAKAINFGLIYGMSAFGLAKQLGIDRQAAQEYVDLYFNRYPGVKLFMDRMRAIARSQGYVETAYGRRLYLPDIQSRNGQRRQYAERAAINAPMQGTAADIIKRAMIATQCALDQSSLRATMLMQVHDELVFEVERGAADAAVELIRHQMTNASDLSVPMVVDIGLGQNWDEAH